MESPKVRTETSVPKRKYKNELRGAWDMIACSPEQPTGYLIAGHCYKHEGYKALLQGKQEAESRKNCRMDILGQLPLEIIHSIFDNYFDRDSITSCSRIPSPHHMLLPSISQHIEEIKIIHNSQLSATLVELFRTTKFPKMRSLNIELKNYYVLANHVDPISYSKLSFILNAFSKTLTILDLYFLEKSTNLPNLSAILNICNSLTTLRYVPVEPDYPVFLPITLTAQQNASLKKLLLSSPCKKDKMKRTDLQKLLKYFPHLSHLAIQNCNESIYTAIRKHGQSIKILQVMPDQYSYNCTFAIKWNNCDNITLYNNSPGLKYV
ncbi:hypothetical protein BDC45DRAFT_608225 [Circinella umbellata]|nr:hypothetical protein BDC45DRAFT_608225 [Circinella umbellata]